VRVNQLRNTPTQLRHAHVVRCLVFPLLKGEGKRRTSSPPRLFHETGLSKNRKTGGLGIALSDMYVCGPATARSACSRHQSSRRFPVRNSPDRTRYASVARFPQADALSSGHARLAVAATPSGTEHGAPRPGPICLPGFGDIWATYRQAGPYPRHLSADTRHRPSPLIPVRIRASDERARTRIRGAGRRWISRNTPVAGKAGVAARRARRAVADIQRKTPAQGAGVVA
jgi:hypothetical protein